MDKHTNSSAGFTLIESLISVSVITIIASIAVPGFVRSKATANEAVVIGSLRSLATAQFKFKTMGMVDTNSNGASEYGWLSEMVGSKPIRETGELLDPNLLSLSFGQVNSEGLIAKRGYYFAVFLPDATGRGLGETPANKDLPNADLSQDYWTCVAWPMNHGATGTSTYFVNQQGDILKATKATYSGLGNRPPAGCALKGVAKENINSQTLAVDSAGSDGNHWVVVKK